MQLPKGPRSRNPHLYPGQSVSDCSNGYQVISRIASLVTILVCALAVAGCANTVRGAKRDINATANAAAS